MIHIHNLIIKHKAGPLNLAQELGYTSRACKLMAISRNTFYGNQELDVWVDYYNNNQTHQENNCDGRSPLETLFAGQSI